jgi:hypothetical protein
MYDKSWSFESFKGNFQGRYAQFDFCPRFFKIARTLEIRKILAVAKILKKWRYEGPFAGKSINHGKGRVFDRRKKQVALNGKIGRNRP